MKRDAILKGERIADARHLRPDPDGEWMVPDSRRQNRVRLDPPCCSCATFGNRRRAGHQGNYLYCKHIWAAQLTVWWEERNSAALEKLPVPVRLTPSWLIGIEPLPPPPPRTDGFGPIPFPTPEQRRLKKDARGREAEDFNEEHLLRLLYELCMDYPDERLMSRRRGRTPWALRHMLFAVLLRSAVEKRSRSLRKHLRDAQASGFLPRDRTPPHPNKVLEYCGKSAVRSALEVLVYATAEPFEDFEHYFAIDSTDFDLPRPTPTVETEGASEPVRVEAKAKLHAVCGMRTGVFVAVNVTRGHAHDGPYFARLMEMTDDRFKIRGVYADNSYASDRNFRYVDFLGATPFIAFRDDATGEGSKRYYKKWLRVNRNDPERFERGQRRRRRIESAFNSLKSKHGDRVASRKWGRIEGEILAKVVCHNVRRVVFAAYDHGIKPGFWPT